MKKIILSEDQIKNIIKMYCEDLMGSHTIFLKTRINKKLILNVLKENNIVLRNPGRLYIGGIKESNNKYSNKPEIKERKKIIHKVWAEKNKEHLKKYISEYRKNNYEKIKKTKRNYEKNRKSVDPIYKLIGNFRTAIYTVIKENNLHKHDHYFKILGYTQEDLIQHLKNLLKDGMTLENYGEWHVDHKQPITSFTFTDISDDNFKKCWSLDNLQPMWGTENISKSNKII